MKLPSSAGAILARRRQDDGHTMLAVAQADGRWSVSDVAEIEASRLVPPGDVARYHAALRKLLP